MKKIPLLLAALAGATFLTPTSVFAAKGEPKESKATLIEKYDKNHDGKLDSDELAQIKSDFLADPKGELKKFDTDHDGKLSDDELAAIAGKKGKADRAEKPGAKKKKNGIE